MLVLLLVGACVSVAGPVALSACWCHIWRASGQASISASTAGEHAAGGHADADGRCTRRALAFPGDLPAGAVLALIGSLALSGW